jgi:hypothetical protein
MLKQKVNLTEMLRSYCNHSYQNVLTDVTEAATAEVQRLTIALDVEKKVRPTFLSNGHHMPVLVNSRTN